VLLRSEPFTQAVPPEARDTDTPGVASGIVLAATHLPAGPRPIIAWAHGTTGYAANCAPSLAADPFTAGALPALDQIISHGWVLVASDYIGLGTIGPQPYLIAQGDADALILPAVQRRFVQELCKAGQTLEYRTYAGRGHVGLVAANSALIPDLVRWTQSRLAGTRQPSGSQSMSGGRL
jgi:hypothetical protein